jgi:hypothetical protein
MGHRAAPAGTGQDLSKRDLRQQDLSKRDLRQQDSSNEGEIEPVARRKSKLLRNGLILAPVALFPFLLLGVLFAFKSSSQKRAIADPAIYAAQTSPAVEAQLGLPIQPGWPVRGSVVSKNGYGNADLQIPLNGSKGKGILSEWAQQEKGKWHICSLDLAAPNGSQLTLVDEATTHCEPE